METAKTQASPAGLLRPETATLVEGRRITIGPQSVETGSAIDARESSQPEIQINRGDLGVESIEVVCSCGERIFIRCEYAQ